MQRVGHWQDVASTLLDGQQTLEDLGRLQRWMTLSKGAGGRVATAYFDIVAVVCSLLLGGRTAFSRPIWIASCILTSLGVLVLCVFLHIAAPLVHDLIDGVALLAFGTGETVSYMMVVMETVFDFLSHVIFWLIIGLGYVVHVLLTVGSVVVGVSAIVLAAVGIYLSLKYDPDNLLSAIY